MFRRVSTACVFRSALCLCAAFGSSSIMEDVLKSHGRKGGGYKQRESAEKMRKLQDTQTSGVAQYLVLILTTYRCPTQKKQRYVFR